MPPSARSGRFFPSTPGRIVTLLRRASRTVDDLAQALDLTDNAIRAHLVALERDGLVQPHGTRRSGGKPAVTYRLTPEAESLFPRAYAQILRAVLGCLAERHGQAEVETVLQTVGRQLASSLDARRQGESLDDRIERLRQVWEELGGLAEVHREGDRLLLQEISCPWKDIVVAQPEACQLAVALLQSALETPAVRGRHDRDPEPRCSFEITPS
jgi:predicted ArsR family transcriptional regulator